MRWGSGIRKKTYHGPAVKKQRTPDLQHWSDWYQDPPCGVSIHLLEIDTEEKRERVLGPGNCYRCPSGFGYFVVKIRSLLRLFRKPSLSIYPVTHQTLSQR
jgi:hypothetical protein